MPRPNLLLVVAEELRANALGCYGNTFCPTPHLDALAARGARLRQHFTVHGKCVPSRVALITATHPSALGCRDLATYPGPEYDDNAFAALRAHGYRTALFGKNHVLPVPRLGGSFDVVPQPGPTFQQYRVEDVTTLSSARRALLQGRIEQPVETTRDWISVDQLGQFLDEGADDSRPFAAWLNFENAHPPYAVPEPFWSAIDRSQVPPPRRCSFADKPAFMELLHRTWQCDQLTPAELIEIKAAYHAQVLMVDAMMARVDALLTARGLRENTIVIFTADHGDWAGEFGLVEKWDTAFQDDLMHIPMLIAGPGITPGTLPLGMSENIDVMPTVFDLLGLPRWAQAQHGRSLQQAFDGQTPARSAVFAQGGLDLADLKTLTPIRTDSIYWGKHACLHADPTTLAAARMLRTETAKIVVRQAGRSELYDLTQDPGECVNGWEMPEYAALKATMLEQLFQHALAACTRLPAIASVMA